MVVVFRMTDVTALTGVHRRFNPLRNSWVLCSPHRSKRPWQGAQEPETSTTVCSYDSTCYLCPRNMRANGSTNPAYTGTYIFENDFAAVVATDAPPLTTSDPNAIFKAESVSGTCFVICYSPRHDLTMSLMTTSEISDIIETWCEIYNRAIESTTIQYCQIFENKGSAMGCSSPHPHGQAWLTSIVPDEPAIEHRSLKKYNETFSSHMLEDYVKKELAVEKNSSRVVDKNKTFVALVPFWATWPFELMILPIKRVSNITSLSPEQRKDLAAILQNVTIRYDGIFQCSFPYSMGLHQAFTSDPSCAYEHLRICFYPPLLRSATVRKFLVGFELLGMPQRDITPEAAATLLRSCSTEHYTQKGSRKLMGGD